jgi:hypothetical protein
MHGIRFIRTLFLCSFALVSCASAQEPRVSGQAGVTVAGEHGYISAGISVGDARLLAAQHNLSGYKPLPPGIQKNLARGKPLPPGIAKTRLPQAFVAQLPQHPGYQWQQAGTDLVLVVSGSFVVQDVLKGVFD